MASVCVFLCVCVCVCEYVCVFVRCACPVLWLPMTDQGRTRDSLLTWSQIRPYVAPNHYSVLCTSFTPTTHPDMFCAMRHRTPGCRQRASTRARRPICGDNLGRTILPRSTYVAGCIDCSCQAAEKRGLALLAWAALAAFSLISN
jgi:hypothetical protein